MFGYNENQFSFLDFHYFFSLDLNINRHYVQKSLNTLPIWTCEARMDLAVADPGGAEGAMAPPGPVNIGHKKDGRQRRPHRFHVSRPPPYPAAGSATVWIRLWSTRVLYPRNITEDTLPVYHVGTPCLFISLPYFTYMDMHPVISHRYTGYCGIYVHIRQWYTRG